MIKTNQIFSVYALMMLFSFTLSAFDPTNLLNTISQIQKKSELNFFAMETQDWEQLFSMQVFQKYVGDFGRMVGMNSNRLEFTAKYRLRPEAKNKPELGKPHVWRRARIKIITSDYKLTEVEEIQKAAQEFAKVTGNEIDSPIKGSYYKMFEDSDKKFENPVEEKAMVMNENEELVEYTFADELTDFDVVAYHTGDPVDNSQYFQTFYEMSFCSFTIKKHSENPKYFVVLVFEENKGYLNEHPIEEILANKNLNEDQMMTQKMHTLLEYAYIGEAVKDKGILYETNFSENIAFQVVNNSVKPILLMNPSLKAFQGSAIYDEDAKDEAKGFLMSVQSFCLQNGIDQDNLSLPVPRVIKGLRESFANEINWRDWPSIEGIYTNFAAKYNLQTVFKANGEIASGGNGRILVI